MGDSHYPRFPGDYQRDTRHLSLAEHGAYNLLLDSYYSTGKPLPESIDALVRIVGAQGQAERGAVRRVVAEFFPLSRDGLRHNARADREIARRELFIADQARKGRLSADAKRQQRFNHGSTTEPTAVQPKPQPKGQPKVNPPLPLPSPLPKPPPHALRACAREGGFAEFWNAYPRKVGKEATLRAWLSVVTNGDADAIMEALAWQKTSEEWQREGGRFVPKPENYLFDKRWTDERPHDATEAFIAAAEAAQ